MSSDGCAVPLMKVVWEILLLALLYLVWDLSADSIYWWCVLLAFIPALGWVFRLLSLPLSVIYRWMHRMQEQMVKRYGRIEDSLTFRDAKRKGEHKTKRGNETVVRILAHALNHPPLGTRLAGLAKLLYLPLIVAYWLMLG